MSCTSALCRSLPGRVANLHHRRTNCPHFVLVLAVCASVQVSISRRCLGLRMSPLVGVRRLVRRIGFP